MAETLALAAVGSAGSAAAGTAATAGLFGSAGAFSFGTSFGTLLSAGSALSSIAGGSQGNAVSKMQARQAELTARQEELRGREQAAQIRRSLSSSLASQNAIFAARGISPTSGTPRTLAIESSAQASRDIDITRFGAATAAGALRTQTSQYKIEAGAKRVEGFGSAAYSLLK